MKKFIIEPNDLLGYRIIPNLHNSLAFQAIGNDTLYKFYLSTDSFSRRIPDSTFMKEYIMRQYHANKHALFLGCSFTIGEGLMYTSTFPYLFEHLNPNYKSYNYGAVGYGPHQIALLFDKRLNMINEEAIPEKKGFALYTYIDSHFERVYGSSNYFTWSYTTEAPNVYIENDSLIIKKWPQAQLRYANFLRDVVLLRKLGVNFSYPQKSLYYKRFASIINYTAKKYWEFRPGNHFYVSIYPGYDKDLNWVQYLDERIVVLKADIPVDYAKNRNKFQVNKILSPFKRS